MNGSDDGSDTDYDSDMDPLYSIESAIEGADLTESDNYSSDSDVDKDEVTVLRARSSTVNTICRLPNFHCGMDHTATNSLFYGVSRNTITSVSEVVHKLWKGLMSNCNYVDIEFMYIKYSNELNTIRFLLDTELDGVEAEHPWSKKLQYLRSVVPLLFSNYFLGQIARTSQEGGVTTNTTGQATKLKLHHTDRYVCQSQVTNIVLICFRFPDIKFGAAIGQREAKRRGLPIKFTVKSDANHKRLGTEARNNWLHRSMWHAYETYGYSYASIPFTNQKSTHDPMWWESVTVYDQENDCRIRVRPGRIIPITTKKGKNQANKREFSVCSLSYILMSRL
ncbi:MAG: hypothetical protein ACE3JU_11490 [Paenibacillus sp.]|uniref:hypothetical protein n=1 Tax=Paenibacillus sp. TaxID=58172 RepID=UPI003B7D65DE